MLLLELKPLPTWPEQREGEQGDEEELQEQQEILSQLLPDVVDVQVLDRAAPEVRARHFQWAASELEEVKQDDERRHGGKDEPLPPAERVDEPIGHYRTNPFRRR